MLSIIGRYANAHIYIILRFITCIRRGTIMNYYLRRLQYYKREYVLPIAQVIGYTIAIGIALSWFYILMVIAAILNQPYLP